MFVSDGCSSAPPTCVSCKTCLLQHFATTGAFSQPFKRRRWYERGWQGNCLGHGGAAVSACLRDLSATRSLVSFSVHMSARIQVSDSFVVVSSVILIPIGQAALGQASVRGWCWLVPVPNGGEAWLFVWWWVQLDNLFQAMINGGVFLCVSRVSP